MSRFCIAVLLPFMALVLAACNENQPAQKIAMAESSLPTGSAGAASSRPTAADWLSVKAREYGDSGVVVALGASMTNAAIKPSFNWQQVSGPAAVIVNPTQINARVVLPFVAAPTPLVFRITAIANG